MTRPCMNSSRSSSFQSSIDTVSARKKADERAAALEAMPKKRSSRLQVISQPVCFPAHACKRGTGCCYFVTSDFSYLSTFAAGSRHMPGPKLIRNTTPCRIAAHLMRLQAF